MQTETESEAPVRQSGQEQLYPVQWRKRIEQCIPVVIGLVCLCMLLLIYQLLRLEHH